MKENIPLVLAFFLFAVGFIIEWRIQGRLRKQDEEKIKKDINRHPIKNNN